MSDAERVARAVRDVHHPKHGENARGPYVICAGCNADWPCATERALEAIDV